MSAEVVPMQKTKNIPNEKETGFGREYVIRGMYRYVNALLTFLFIVTVIAFVWSQFAWWKYSQKLLDKRWVVFYHHDGKTTVHDASEFQMGPLDKELDGRAWDIVRWIPGADSFTVNAYYAEARKFMTNKMRQDFDATLNTEEARKELRDLQVYRRIENAEVRQVTPKDLPAGSKKELDRYDRIVTGRLDTYRTRSNELIMSSRFAYHVRIVPAQDRTIENSTATMVASFIPLKSSPDSNVNSLEGSASK
jgi:hypothetical protein